MANGLLSRTWGALTLEGWAFLAITALSYFLTILVFKSWIAELISYFFLGAALSQLRAENKTAYAVMAAMAVLLVFAAYIDPILKPWLDIAFSVDTVTGPLTLLNLLNMLPLLAGFWIFRKRL